MGVINLGLLVEKIKRKLEDSGFIKNTDYATASAAGVVKIGNNIDVTEAGVISVPDATESTKGVVSLSDIVSGGMEKIYEEESTPKDSTSSITLSKSSADYSALFIVYKRSGAVFGTLCSAIQDVANYTSGVRLVTNKTPDTIAFTPSGTSLSWNYNNNSSITWYAVYGIK